MSSTDFSPAEIIALANSCPVTNVANIGFEVLKSYNFLTKETNFSTIGAFFVRNNPTTIDTLLLQPV